MKVRRSLWIAVGLLVIWLLMSWFAGSHAGFKSPANWYLIVGFWVLGIIGFVGYILLKPKQESTVLEGTAATAAAEIDYNFAEATKRIQAATGKKQLNTLPAIFLLGDTGSAKTSIIMQSGTEAELAAGRAAQDNAALPTSSVNLWYSRSTLFIDPAGTVVADAGTRRKLFKKFLPIRFNSLMASRDAPTRAVLLTVSCETFLQPGGANALAGKSRDYQAILGELSRELGASFPVYVLFTKADKIPYFRDYVENLSEQEAGEILGVSLPILPRNLQGSYSEQQSLRLNNAFQAIYYSLADTRPVYLSREHTAANLSNIYEFPREFSKLRPLLVQFLTDVCRPSQLGTSPFLRGFYFCGVRPITVNDVVPASRIEQMEDAEFDAGATRIFSRSPRSSPVPDARAESTRRVPQWVFLRNLFTGVLLPDNVGATVAQSNVKVNFARRFMMAAAVAIAVSMAVWWTVSFSNNSALVHDAVDAAKSVPAVGLAPGQLASVDSLRRLTRVRDTLSILNKYERKGPPWSYRAFLYKGNDIREPLRETYYALFRRLLLQPTQQTLVAISTKPDSYGSKGYSYVYNVLKAYLITTNHHEKVWAELPSVLTQHWKKDQSADSEQEKLASRNFEFYADELAESDPFPQFVTPDPLAIDNARSFLRRFAQEDRIYRAMLDAASDKLKPIVFNRDYPGTEDAVRNVYHVEPWFLKPAYINFQKQLQNPDAYFNGEEWVLGKETVQSFDKAKMVADLKARYDQDFIKTWREYLVATSEAVPYASYVRAATVLDKLGSPQSPLMKLFCVASENTSVPTKEVSIAFQPVQLITPPGCERQLVAAAANPYVASLGNLGNALRAIGPLSSPNQSAAAAAQSLVGSALNSETTLALGFQSDPSDPKATVLVRAGNLLKEPINQVTPTLQGVAGAAINGQAADVCAAISPLFRKYPFNPASKEDASLQEVNEFLKPQDGKLWAFVKGTLAPYVQQAGSEYIASSGQSSRVTSSFLTFLNRVSHISQALYRGDAANPNMSFSMQASPSENIDQVSLAIDGNTLGGDPKSRPAQTFTWPGATQGFSLSVRVVGSTSDLSITNKTGLWAVWHALERADKATGNLVQWTPATQGEGPVMVKGQPLTAKFTLDPQSAQLLRPQYFSGLNCPSKAVQ